jgi:hypothetical protein
MAPFESEQESGARSYEDRKLWQNPWLAEQLLFSEKDSDP